MDAFAKRHRGFGWRRPVTQQIPGHIYPPKRPGKPHTTTTDCWCNPVTEVSGTMRTVVHRDVEPPEDTE